MDRNQAVREAQQSILAENKRLIDSLLEAQKEREASGAESQEIEDLPLIGVTCATGWECYAIVEELVKSGKFRVRATYRTPGTQAAGRLERLLEKTEAATPGLLSLKSGVDLTSVDTVSKAFQGCDGIVLYVTANIAKAGKITNHGNDPEAGRRVVLNQVDTVIAAIKENPSVKQIVTLVFPTNKITGVVKGAPKAPWWVAQRLEISDYIRDIGINVTTLHRPAYYYAMHRVDYTDPELTQFRGDTRLSKNMIRENNLPGINEPDFLVNWIDVRDVGKWVGTVMDYPEVFKNKNLSIASCAHTGQELVKIANDVNKHGTRFKYSQFPRWVMKMISFFNEEVIYPLRYAQWYNDQTNAYDFAKDEDLAHLKRVHDLWTFETKLKDWGIDQIKPAKK